jgi:hypothetical protein
MADIWQGVNIGSGVINSFVKLDWFMQTKYMPKIHEAEVRLD